MPSPAVYRQRFGSLIRAYELIGYTPDRDYAFAAINRALRRDAPETRERDDRVLSRCQRTEGGEFLSLVRLVAWLRPHITIVVRLDALNETALDSGSS